MTRIFTLLQLLRSFYTSLFQQYSLYNLPMSGQSLAKACGKCLLTGGYAILDGHPGVSVAVDVWASAEVRVADSVHPEGISSDVFGSYQGSLSEAPNHLKLAALAAGSGHNVKISTEAHFGSAGFKTGLGSSAAVAAAVAAAAAAADGEPEKSCERAFTAHKIYQNGKGSGYDVLTALAKRSVVFCAGQVTPIGGASSPVRKLPLILCAPTQASGESTVDAIKRCTRSGDRYSAYCQACTTATHALTRAITHGTDARQACAAFRRAQQAWNPSIEPSAYIPVLDAVLGVPGVIWAVCPGAGGWDAAAVLAADDTAAEEVVEVVRQHGWTHARLNALI